MLDHEMVIIDSELMFSTDPSDVRETNWWTKADGSPSCKGMKLTRQVCLAIGELSDKNLSDCLVVPNGIELLISWDIREIIFQGRIHCQEFLSKQIEV